MPNLDEQIAKWKQRRKDTLAALEPETHKIILNWESRAEKAKERLEREAKAKAALYDRRKQKALEELPAKQQEAQAHYDQRKRQALDRLAQRTADSVARYDARLSTLYQQRNEQEQQQGLQRDAREQTRQLADSLREQAQQDAQNVPTRPIHSKKGMCSLCTGHSLDAYAVGANPEKVVCPMCKDRAQLILSAQQPIPGCPGYAATPDGGIYTAGRLRPMTVRNNTVQLYLSGSQTCRSTPNLVLRTFIGPPAPGQRARHIDGDKTNNRLENLEWA